MKTEQHTAQTSTALLRNANSVDAPETNSLCCAAAGITASTSATAEVLIPHEKLREAAHPDATLNAQNRQPAQPVEGYRHPLHTQQDAAQPMERVHPGDLKAITNRLNAYLGRHHQRPVPLLQSYAADSEVALLSANADQKESELMEVAA